MLRQFHERIICNAHDAFPWITLDHAGNIYVSWAGRDRATDPINAYLAHSNDHGRTWSAPFRVNRDIGNAHIYTTVSAGDRGVVDMASSLLHPFMRIQCF